MYTDIYKSPVGILEIKSNTKYLLSVKPIDPLIEDIQLEETKISYNTKIQLEKYFNGNSQYFNLPLIQNNNLFSQKVFEALNDVKIGKVITYKYLAYLAEKPKAYRAVGNIIGKNPYMIIQPCHRVLKTDGSLGGYAWGINIKQILLDLEKKV